MINDHLNINPIAAPIDAEPERAVLIGLITPEQNEAKVAEYLDELEFLADTAGAVTAARFTQKVGGPNARSYCPSLRCHPSEGLEVTSLSCSAQKRTCNFVEPADCKFL